MGDGWRSETLQVGDTGIVVIRGGHGRPLLVLHDELGHPGWMAWNRALAEHRELICPLQPGFGQTPKVDWISDYRDLASLYNCMVRAQGWAPLDVMGFSAGGYTAAEMVAAAPELFNSVVLVAPLGCRPTDGEIFDFFAVTVSAHVAATVSRQDAPEFSQIYGGEMTPEQFEAFQDARGETARIGWEPFMFNPSLPDRLRGIGPVPVLLIRGDADIVTPASCIDVYQSVLPKADAVELRGVGHRPEIEDPEAFVGAVSRFFGL